LTLKNKKAISHNRQGLQLNKLEAKSESFNLVFAYGAGAEANAGEHYLHTAKDFVTGNGFSLNCGF
jgi:hypothetical protein